MSGANLIIVPSGTTTMKLYDVDFAILVKNSGLGHQWVKNNGNTTMDTSGNLTLKFLKAGTYLFATNKGALTKATKVVNDTITCKDNNFMFAIYLTGTPFEKFDFDAYAIVGKSEGTGGLQVNPYSSDSSIMKATNFQDVSRLIYAEIDGWYLTLNDTGSKRAKYGYFCTDSTLASYNTDGQSLVSLHIAQ